MARSKSKRRTGGLGSVLPRANGRFTAIVTDPDTGKRRSIGTFDSELDAERAISREVAAGGRGSDAEASFGLYLSRWIEGHAGYVSATMTKRYRGDAARYVLPWPIASVRLGDLAPDHFRKLFSELRARGGKDGRPLAASTVEGVERMIVAAIGEAIRDGKLRKDPLPPTRLPKTKTERAWADTEQVARLLRVVALNDPDLEVAVRLAAIEGGLRRAEVAGLNWGDVGPTSVTIARSRTIDGETGAVKEGTTKTEGSKATVALHPATVAAFARMRAAREAELGRRVPKSEPVYATPEGEPLYPDTIAERFARVVKAYNVTHADEPLRRGFTFHSLRHSFASNLIAAGVPTIIVAAAGRWESVALVERLYGHHAPSTVAEAVGLYAAAVEEAGG